MNVLSLFDGMSCGQIALNNLGIKYEKYFSSEIDKHAISVTQRNYPNTIQLGDVTKVNSKDLPKIDLLIGGSPCQGFSFQGKQLNFSDFRSKLFFEYVRLLKELKPKYFFLENVVMKKEFENSISEILEAKAVHVNSRIFSAQNRPRVYWTNIQYDEFPTDDCPENYSDIRTILSDDVYWKDYQVQKLLNKQYIRKDYYWSMENYNKVPTLQAQMGLSRYKEMVDGRVRVLNPTEWEKLQTVPVGYTEGVSRIQRYKMLGNGWTVKVIEEFFKKVR